MNKILRISVAGGIWRQALLSSIVGLVLSSSTAVASSITISERPITTTVASDRSASASGAGTAFVSNRVGDFDLWIELGGIEFLIAGGVGSQTSPALDGTRIAYVDTSAGNNNIAWVDVMVGSVNFLSISVASDTDPAISGDLVTFVSDRTGSPGIYVADLTSGIVFTVADGPGAEIDPDVNSNTIVWSAFQNGSFDIFASDFGGVPFVVADGPGQELAPSIWGNQIAYIVDDDVGVFDRSTGMTTQITHDSFIQRDVIIRDNLLVWTDDRNGNNDIFLHDMVNSQTFQLTNDLSGQRLGGFTGDRVVFDDLRTGDLNVWEVSFSITPDPIPEPTTILLLGLGLAGLGFARRRLT